jgi:hypothetical protein
MENKFISSILERSHRKKHFQLPLVSSESPVNKLKRYSLTPVNPRPLRLPYNLLSNFEKEIINACKDVNIEINEIQNKADAFITEIDDRINYVKLNPPVPKSPSELISPKIRTQTSKKMAQPSPPPQPHLSVQKRSVKKKRNNSIEDLMRTTRDPKDKNREEIIFELQKSLGNIKTPCIEGLYAKISRNEYSFQTYKKIRNNDDIDPFVAFNQVCSAEHMPPIPLLTHIQDNTLTLNRYRINDTIALALGDSLALMPYLKKLHLDENSISDAGGANLLKGLIAQQQITSFFYTSNEIGQKFINKFKDFLRLCPVTEISLRGCKTPPNLLIDLVPCFRTNKKIKKLCLSEIGLNNSFMTKFCKYIRRSNIAELDLSWNQIPQDASLKFFKTLKNNKKITMLDYSWNSLGSEEGDICIILNQALMQHPNLMHLNLSYTQLNDSNFLSLCPGLQSSRTLVCLHFTGNNISQKRISTMMIHLIATNKLAFIADSGSHVLHPIEGIGLANIPQSSTIHNVKFRDRTGKCVNVHRDTLPNIAHSSNYHDRLHSKNNKIIIFSRYLGESTTKDLKNWIVSEHCWICERWVPYTLKININSLESLGSASDFQWSSSAVSNVKLKCSFNIWDDIPLDSADSCNYDYVSLLPPGLHKFWVIKDNSEVCVTRQVTRKNWNGYKVNEINVSIRNYDLEPIAVVKEDIKIFDKNKSVFKNFVEDTDQTRKIMFENDKKHLKLNRIIKDEAALKDVYKVLLDNFAVIKEIFDATCAASAYPNIGWLDFSNFCDHCQLLDTKFLNRAAIDRCFIAVNVDFDDLDDNPQQELCRYEFFEIIARIAMCKYQDLPLTQAEMTQKLLEEHIFKYCDSSQAIKFRREKLYTYDVNSLLEANLSNCQILFSKYKVKSGRWISLDLYKKIIKSAGIALKDEEIIKIYAFSKMSILDEMGNADSYDKMLFVEFLESIGRLSNAAFQDKDIELVEMMEKTLDMLFSKNGIKKRLPEIPKNSSDESED